jgi:hypothetical protein
MDRRHQVPHALSDGREHTPRIERGPAVDSWNMPWSQSFYMSAYGYAQSITR